MVLFLFPNSVECLCIFKSRFQMETNIYLIVFILVSSQSYLFAVEDYKMAGMTVSKPVLDLGPSPFSREELLRRVANITNDRFRQDTIPGRVRDVTKEFLFAIFLFFIYAHEKLYETQLS